MKVILEPLGGKYYGTRILVGDGLIEVWGCGKNQKPSARERKLWEPEEPEICDSHYETQGDYEIALAIIAALRPYDVSLGMTSNKQGVEKETSSESP